MKKDFLVKNFCFCANSKHENKISMEKGANFLLSEVKKMGFKEYDSKKGKKSDVKYMKKRVTMSYPIKSERTDRHHHYISENNNILSTI